MDEELKQRINRAVALKQVETGSTTNFAQWMREAAREKLARETDSSGTKPEETGVA